MVKTRKDPAGQQPDNSKAKELSTVGSWISAKADRIGGSTLAEWGQYRVKLFSIVTGMRGRTGRHLDPETVVARAKTFDLLDKEVADGRNPDAPKVAGAIAQNVMKDPNKVRAWRKEWKKDRGRN